MSLTTGNNSIRSNVEELMGKVQSNSRMKAIRTIAKKNHISLEEAKFRQAIRIAQSQARK